MTEREEQAPQRPRRVPSGIPTLDRLLGGGLLRGDLYVVVGAPGAGKTILANQACFAHVAAGGRAAYVTLLAETHGHMLAHLRALAFFDPAPIGSALLYYSGYEALTSDGLDGLLAFLRGVMRDDKVTLLVLDGLVTANEAADSQLAFRTFLVNLQAYGEASGCTTLLLTQPLDGGMRDPSYTIVDGVIELGTTRLGPRIVRQLEIHKFRGGSYLGGQHVFEIGDAGITVHPRIEAALGAPALEVGGHRPRVSTGLPPLDAMLHGGLLSGSTTMLLAPPGSGKTLLGLHVLDAGAQAGEPGLHFGFYETPPLLVETAAAIGLDLGRQVADGRITVLWQPPLEESEDALAERLLAMVAERGIRRLFIDGLDGFLQAAVYPERMGRFFTALTLALRARGVTTLISVELPTLFGTTAEIPLPGVSAIAENIVVLRAVERRSQLYRLLSIVKTRGSGHDPAIRAFTIGETGLALADTSASAEEILDGTVPPAAPPADGADETGGQRA